MYLSSQQADRITAPLYDVVRVNSDNSRSVVVHSVSREAASRFIRRLLTQNPDRDYVAIPAELAHRLPDPIEKLGGGGGLIERRDILAVMESIPATAVFDGSIESLSYLFALHPKGTAFLCPVCGIGLTVALTWDEARQQGIHPGVFCPQDDQHVSRLFNLKGN